MAKISVQAGSTGVSVNLFINSSTSTTGLGQAGIVFNAASFTCYYVRQRTTATPITLATSTVGNPWVTGGFIQIDSVNAPGWYNFDIPNIVLGTGSPFASVHFQGAANMAPLPLEIELTAWNNQDIVTGGLIAISSTGTLGSVSNVRGTSTVVLAAGTHTGVVIPVVQTASNVINVTGTATVVLWGGTHTGAVIPVIQTASVALVANNVGTATSVLLVDTVRTSTVSNFTAGALGRFFDLDAGQYSTSSAQSVVKQISDNAIGAGGAPTVAQITTAVWAKFGTGTVMLSTGTHTGAIIPNVLAINTSSDGRMANLDAAVSSRSVYAGGAVASVTAGVTTTSVADKTGYTLSVQNWSSAGDQMALTAAERTSLTTVIGTSVMSEAYRANGAAGSIAQLLYEALGHLGESVIVTTSTAVGGATKSIRKIDHTTTAATFLLNDTSSPTSITRNS